MSRLIASLSLDLDNKWSYLKTHGDPGWESYPSYLDVVVPRFLRVLRELDLRITVFVVGQDALEERNHLPLASIAAAGHEIGNHSLNHEPWLHLYTAEEIEAELSAAEEALEAATGVRPTGFRGPGYSLSPAVIASLARRGYQYDASTLPTSLGPLARAYYFLHAKLSPEQRRQRKKLFGDWRAMLQPIRPYWWEVRANHDDVGCEPRRLLEIPVTTMPLLRVPIHVSYMLYLRQFSQVAARTYWRLAMRMCQLTGIGPSLLLHPLDFYGADDDHDLGFFPGMRLPGQLKVDFVRERLSDFANRFEVLPMGEYATAIAEQMRLRVRSLNVANVPELAMEPAEAITS